MPLYIPSITIAANMITNAYLQKNYSQIIEVMDYVINTPTIAGNADAYHNASVQLTQIQDYANAVCLLEHGLNRYPRSADLLADLLLYGLECRKVSEISTYYFDKLAKINKKFWTWRAFHFSIDFLMVYIQYSDTNEQERTVTEEIIALIDAYKTYFPTDERAYMVEYTFYTLICENQKALDALKQATETLTVCSQCALNYADYYFEHGEYDKVIPIVEKAINVREDQPSINLGYAYYILALSKEYVLRHNSSVLNQDNVTPVFNAYYSALEFLDTDKQTLISQIKNRVKILERESGIESFISFDNTDSAIPEKLRKLLNFENKQNIIDII